MSEKQDYTFDAKQFATELVDVSASSFKWAPFVAMRFQWNDVDVNEMWEGGVTPKPGDRIETVCYFAEGNEARARFRVVPPDEGKTEGAPAVEREAHSCRNCEGVAPETCLFAPPAEVREPEQWPQWVKDAVRNANEAGRAAGRAEAREPVGDALRQAINEVHEAGSITELWDKGKAAKKATPRPDEGKTEGGK